MRQAKRRRAVPWKVDFLGQKRFTVAAPNDANRRHATTGRQARRRPAAAFRTGDDSGWRNSAATRRPGGRPDAGALALPKPAASRGPHRASAPRPGSRRLSWERADGYRNFSGDRAGRPRETPATARVPGTAGRRAAACRGPRGGRPRRSGPTGRTRPRSRAPGRGSASLLPGPSSASARCASASSHRRNIPFSPGPGPRPPRRSPGTSGPPHSLPARPAAPDPRPPNPPRPRGRDPGPDVLDPDHRANQLQPAAVRERRPAGKADLGRRAGPLDLQHQRAIGEPQPAERGAARGRQSAQRRRVPRRPAVRHRPPCPEGRNRAVLRIRVFPGKQAPVEGPEVRRRLEPDRKGRRLRQAGRRPAAQPCPAVARARPDEAPGADRVPGDRLLAAPSATGPTGPARPVPVRVLQGHGLRASPPDRAAPPRGRRATIGSRPAASPRVRPAPPRRSLPRTPIRGWRARASSRRA